MKYSGIFLAYYAWMAIRYFVLSGFSFRWIVKNKGGYANLRKGQVRREIQNSLISFVVFTIIGVFMIYAMEAGLTQTYFNISEKGVLYLIASILGMLLFHDVYFYFTHRLMHEVKWLAKFHRVHHESVHTNPYSAFSFHWMEALIAAGAGMVFMFAVPLHPVAFFIFQLIMVGFNVIGHMGHDLFPNSSRWVSSSAVHNLHHLKGRGNYGLYTTFWDWIFNTQAMRK